MRGFHATEIVGYALNCEIYCADCADCVSDGEPIFAGSEDAAETCGDCGERLLPE